MGGPIKLGRWIHFCETFDGQGSYSLWIDGVRVETRHCGGLSPLGSQEQLRHLPILIGGAMSNAKDDQRQGGGDHSDFFQGQIAELQLWGAELTSEDCRAQMTGGHDKLQALRPDLVAEKLVAWWPCVGDPGETRTLSCRCRPGEQDATAMPQWSSACMVTVGSGTMFFMGQSGILRPFGFVTKEEIASSDMTLTQCKHTVTVLLRALKCWHSAFKAAMVAGRKSQVLHEAMAHEQFGVVQLWSAAIMDMLSDKMGAAFNHEVLEDPDGMQLLRQCGMFEVEGGTRQPVPEWALLNDDDALLASELPDAPKWAVGLPKGHIYCDHLFLVAESIQPSFFAALRELLSSCAATGEMDMEGVSLTEAPMKKFDRAVDKISNDYASIGKSEPRCTIDFAAAEREETVSSCVLVAGRTNVVSFTFPSKAIQADDDTGPWIGLCSWPSVELVGNDWYRANAKGRVGFFWSDEYIPEPGNYCFVMVPKYTSGHPGSIALTLPIPVEVVAEPKREEGEPAAAFLQDIVRATYCCDKASQAAHLLGKLDKFVSADGRTAFTLRRVKNRFALSEEEIKKYNGYRDLNANILVTATVEGGESLQHVCEVQITLNEIAAAKHEMHKFYGLVRAQLYSELNLSHVQKGPQSVPLDELGWTLLDAPVYP